ncbi:MAG: Jag N-terminal domain-containing protein [Proteobacteria bacterium]|nr:Jag N-terminal domain-containing protein [Pseudomonadota bacterium]
MSLDKNDYYGKDVSEAIKKACEALGVPQETLDIEVVETGSSGIFGLIRKKARIRVQIKPPVKEAADIFEVSSFLGSKTKKEQLAAAEIDTPEAAPLHLEKVADEDDDEEDDLLAEAEQEGDASPESIEIVKEELLRIVELMGFPSTLEVKTTGLAVICTLRGDFEENLAGPEGKVLDSLQYILRKILSRKVQERLRISINVGLFREKRLEELKVKAAELAALVKEDGKTQVLPGLNPSERRIIHMFFQEDKEIRSRSVGDGLFKKILIYKPGKGNRPSGGGRKRSSGKGRQGKTGPKNNRES